MGKTKAQIRATEKFNKNNYERLSCSIPIGEREIIKGFAQKQGLSLAQYIRQACYEKTGQKAPAMKKEEK